MTFVLAAALFGPLYEQSLVRVLEARYGRADLAYILVDARSREVIAARWPAPERAAPLGSVLKPFPALAYGETHGFDYPQVVCRGVKSRCWLPTGHGRVGIVEALAESCNAYFLSVSRGVRPERLGTVANRFGLDGPPADAAAPELFGLGGKWKAPPLAVMLAYAELARRAGDPGVAPVVRGLAAAADRGTARAIGARLGRGKALAKTGTAPCVHRPAAPGDGYAIAVVPLDTPSYVVLVRLHGQPGIAAAGVLASMLATIAEGK